MGSGGTCWTWRVIADRSTGSSKEFETLHRIHIMFLSVWQCCSKGDRGDQNDSNLFGQEAEMC